VKRYQVKHCRDKAVHDGSKWDVWETDTADTLAEPVWLGYGSHEACLAYAVGLARLRATTGVRP